MVKTRLECGRCRRSVNMCVRVRRGVPDFLRCEHDQHGGVRKDGSGGIVCEQCGSLWRLSGDDLTQEVERLLNGDMPTWRRERAVVLVCGGR